MVKPTNRELAARKYIDVTHPEFDPAITVLMIKTNFDWFTSRELNALATCGHKDIRDAMVETIDKIYNEPA